jgi:phosphoesterase RecJ-like protein
MKPWDSPAPPLADWKPLEKLIAQHQRFVLTTHMNPDGDGLGSEVGLALYLSSQGKDVTVLNDGAVPPNFEFLSRLFPMQPFDETWAREVVDAADVVIMLDTAVRPRLGRVAPLLSKEGLPVVILDHHLGEPTFGTLAIVVPQACAAGELVYDFVRRQPGGITKPIAEALYTAVVTDTGSFRFANTDPEAHAMAAHLVSAGASPEPMHAVIYQHRHPGRVRFQGDVWSKLALSEDGRVAWMEVDRATMHKYGVDSTDTEGLVDFPRNIRGVEAVALVSETPNGEVKMSLRSTGRVNVERVAASFGGGGHRAAAGATIAGPLTAGRERVVAALHQAVDEAIRGDGHAPASGEPRAAAS